MTKIAATLRRDGEDEHQPPRHGVRLETSFSFYGTKPDAMTVFASDRKALDMTVKGSCAWVAPSARTNPTSADSQELHLAYFR